MFVEIGWKNQINENEEGELVILPNSHRYKVKKEVSTYDFIVKTIQNKEYKIYIKKRSYLISIDFSSISAAITFCFASSSIWTFLFLAFRASCSASTFSSIAFSKELEYHMSVIRKSVTSI